MSLAGNDVEVCKEDVTPAPFLPDVCLSYTHEPLLHPWRRDEDQWELADISVREYC